MWRWPRWLHRSLFSCGVIVALSSVASLLGSVAFVVQLQDDRVMDEPVNGRCGGHGIFEDLVPLTEDQVGGDHQALALVALGQKRQQHLHLLTVLLHIADVIEHHHLIVVQLAQHGFQPELLLGYEHVLHQVEGRDEQHRAVVMENQFPSDRTE